MLMLPREHGAYSQMALPLVTSLVVAGITLPAALTGLAVVLGFLAHEPLLVRLGRRGARVRADLGRRATVALAACGAMLITVGVAAVWQTPPTVRWSFALPLVPAVVVAAGLFTRQEKSAPAEIAAALAFSLAAVPICLGGGTSVATALSIGIAFALVFVVGTLSVRVVILKVRGGGRPRAVRATRAILVAMAAAAAIVLAATASRGALSWTTLVAIGPGLIAAVSLAFRRQAPKLRTVGWTLMSASAAAALVLIAGVR